MVLLVQTGGFASLAHIATYLSIGLIPSKIKDFLKDFLRRNIKKI
jgi:hypothetical protein